MSQVTFSAGSPLIGVEFVLKGNANMKHIVCQITHGSNNKKFPNIHNIQMFRHVLAVLKFKNTQAQLCDL